MKMKFTRVTIGTRCTWSGRRCDIGVPQLPNLLMHRFNRFFKNLYKKSWRWHSHASPLAPGVPGAVADVILVFRDLQNLLMHRFNRFFKNLYKNSWRCHSNASPSYSCSATSKKPPCWEDQLSLFPFVWKLPKMTSTCVTLGTKWTLGCCPYHICVQRPWKSVK